MGIVCIYCNVANPDKEKTCIACGAPLKKTTLVATKPEAVKPAIANKPAETVEAARKIATAYSSIWKAFFDAIIIAAVAFAIGLSGGIVNQPLFGVLGAALLGFAVSFTIKSGITTLISAPVGLLVGSIFCIMALILNLPAFLYPVFLTIWACITAVFGGTKIPYNVRTTWYKIRPLLGTTGGFVFGLMGMGVGLGLQVVYTNLAQFLQELG
jgi:hypothetical protein